MYPAYIIRFQATPRGWPGRGASLIRGPTGGGPPPELLNWRGGESGDVPAGSRKYGPYGQPAAAAGTQLCWRGGESGDGGAGPGR